MIPFLLFVAAVIACLICFRLGMWAGVTQRMRDEYWMLGIAEETFHDQALSSEERHIAQEAFRHVRTAFETYAEALR